MIYQKPFNHQELPHSLAPDINDEIDKLNEDGNKRLSLESSILMENTSDTQNNILVSTISQHFSKSLKKPND